jgi:hypothetical protein
LIFGTFSFKKKTNETRSKRRGSRARRLPGIVRVKLTMTTMKRKTMKTKTSWNIPEETRISLAMRPMRKQTTKTKPSAI